MRKPYELWVDRRATQGHYMGFTGYAIEYHKAYTLNLQPEGQRIHMVDFESYKEALNEIDRLTQIVNGMQTQPTSNQTQNNATKSNAF